MKKTIPVLCIVFPDGTVIWTDAAEHDHIRSLRDAWWDKLPADTRLKYEEAGVCGGVVEVRMLREDYRKATA